MIQSFDMDIPTEQLPYKLSLTQCGLDLIQASKKKASMDVDIDIKDAVTIGTSVLIKAIMEIAKVA